MATAKTPGKTPAKKPRKPRLATHEVRAQQRKVILELLSEGKSLEYSARAVGITPPAVFGWLKADPVFADGYARAREIGYSLLGEQLNDIADEEIPLLPSGGLDAAAVAHQRLRVDTRKWMLAKMLPKVYGDKIQHEGEIKLDAADALIQALGKR